MRWVFYFYVNFLFFFLKNVKFTCAIQKFERIPKKRKLLCVNLGGGESVDP